MKLFNSFFDAKINFPTAITIGKFDGIHLGHHALISEIISKKNSGFISCIITFTKSPRIVLSKDIKLSLFTNEERYHILEKFGIDYLFLCEFNKKFMELQPIKFIEILCKNLNMKYLVVGSDFTFGFKGAGNADLLKNISRIFGFELKVISKIQIDNINISSTLIRKELNRGNLNLVNRMLGYNYFILGEIINSKTILGMCCVYIRSDRNKLLPKCGFYFTKIFYEDKVYNGFTKILKKTKSFEDSIQSEDEIIIKTYSKEIKNISCREPIKICFNGESKNFFSMWEGKEELHII